MPTTLLIVLLLAEEHQWHRASKY